MKPDLVDVVLVRPFRPANVAAACRAMKNMGLSKLWIVDPPLGLDEARGFAYGAWDVLDSAQRVSSLLEASSSSTLVVGTSGRALPGAWTPREFVERAASRAGGGRVALVFGPEATGLRRDELELCHAFVHIPTHPAQPSLNLAQAVLLLAYEVFLSETTPSAESEGERASSGDIEEALAALKDGLVAISYLNPSNPGAILAEFRGLLVRAAPTPREATLLRGLARQILWAGREIARCRETGG
jgi:TrmH family RNA methyltransferase